MINIESHSQFIFQSTTFKKIFGKKIFYETQCDSIAINLLLHFHQNMPAFWKILFKYFSGNMGIIFAFFSLSCQIKNVRKTMKYIFQKASIIIGKLGNNKYLFQLKEGSCRAGGLGIWNTFVADVLIPWRTHGKSNPLKLTRNKDLI